MIKLIYTLLFFSIYATAVDYSIENEGYVNGFSYDCPEYVEQPITPAMLRRLVLSVMGPGTSWSAKITPYNYYDIGNLARDPGVDFKKKTLILVGGYLEKNVLPLLKNIGHLYINMGYNVLILNTSEFTSKSYCLSVNTVRPVGKCVAEMLFNLTAVGLDPKKLEVVSHGLGGHTMGFIAKNYRRITGRNISSLTALDPAGPCFRHLGPEDRLDPSDADFVLSMATNMDGFGIAIPVGHVTFYVNGGEYQTTDPLVFRQLSFILCTIDCSHVKSIHYWISALINPRTFIGVKCDTVQQAREGDCYDIKPMVTNTMDLYTDRSKPGVYFVRTLNYYPYGLKKKGLGKDNNPVASELSWLSRANVLKAR